MDVQVAHAVVHTPEQVEVIVNDAVAITERQGGATPSADAVFTAACQLLGQRSAVVMQQASPLTPDLQRLLQRGAG